MITTIKRSTIEYLAFLAQERNEEIRQRDAAFKEGMQWKESKYGGRADICFEMYEQYKNLTDSKRILIKNVTRALDAKLMFAGTDNAIIGIEQKVNGKWVTVAKSELEIKQLSDMFVSDLILGAYDHTDSKE